MTKHAGCCTRQQDSEHLHTAIFPHSPSPPPTAVGSDALVSRRPASTSPVPGASYLLDKARVRRAASRAAPHYDASAWLPRQVAAALMEHLQPVRIQPAVVLDAGTGTGICSQLLTRRYPGARVVCLDSSEAMLRAARSRTRRWFSKRAFTCADAEALPLAEGSIDLLVSSLMLPSCSPPDAVLTEFRRVLAPGGLLMFASLGPDTLCELRESWTAVDRKVHVHAFIDMHDVGDALLRAGFQDVVMDVERFTGHYPDVTSLVHELKRLGVSNAARGCAKSLTTPAALEALAAAYEGFRRGTSLPASFEVVFGHAWRPAVRRVEVSAAAMLPRGN